MLKKRELEDKLGNEEKDEKEMNNTEKEEKKSQTSENDLNPKWDFKC